MLKGKDMLNDVSKIDRKYIKEAEKYGDEDTLLGKPKKRRTNGLLPVALVGFVCTY